MVKYFKHTTNLGSSYYRTSPTGFLYFWNEIKHGWEHSGIPMKSSYMALEEVDEDHFTSYMTLRELVS